MRVLFFGTSPFAVPTLDALHESGHTILAVVTQPDRPSGRGMKLQPSPVKARALELGYEILQPEKVRRKPFPQTVAELAPDVLVVISFGQIISQAVLDIPRFGGINVHASLLPRWRGAAPIHWAILSGDAETGVATMQMEASLDTGPVFLEERIPIGPDETVETLEPRLAALGGPLLVRTLDALEAGGIASTPQSESGMVYAYPVTRETGLMDPATESAAALERKVRALLPRPAASILLNGKPVKVLAASIAPAIPDVTPSTIAALPKNGIAVATSDGTLLLTRVQPENKGPMNAADFARGARLAIGDAASKPADLAS